MEFRQIPLARIGDDEYDQVVFAEAARQLQGRAEVRARRAAAEDALFAAEPARELKRIPVRDVDNLVDVFHVDVFRDDLLAYAFYEVRRGLHQLARLFISLKDRAVWVGANDADLWILLL